MNFAAMLYDGEPEFTAPKAEKPKPKPKPKPDHSEAREIYEKYLVKAAELKKHQDYAHMVAMATDGPSMTPVRPLATLGNNGGALLCDCCLKPIILEGGEYHGVYADEAWKRAPDPKWVSYIKGGLVVRVVENGTLRIYHGYERNPTDCCSKAERELREQENAYVRDVSKGNKVFKFLEDEFGSTMTYAELNKLLSDVCKVMFSFDPGYGVNRP